MNATGQLSEIAAAVADGGGVDWDRAAAASASSAPTLLDHLRVLERIAAFHARLPPIDTFVHSLHDSLLRELADRPAQDDTAPATWGPLTIGEWVGGGSYADVYRAHDPSLDRTVALKLLRRRETPAADLGRQVIDEARLAARVHHPNVVTIFGADRVDGRVGIWMQFVDGPTLADDLRTRGPLPAREIATIGAALCGALQAVHDAGLLHRDVKAANAMRDRDGRILLADFGTGHDVADAGSSHALAGTPLYLAPEVLTGSAASIESDVYSLGVLLHHLATGSFPVRGRTIRDLRDAHARGAHEPVARRRLDLPGLLANAIDRATAPDPARRFHSTAAFEAALAAAVSHRPPVARARVAAVAALTLAAAVSGGYLVRRASRPRSAASAPVTPKRLLANSAELPTEAAAVSPDGASIAYVDRTGLTIRTIATGEDHHTAVPENIAIDNLAWFPDGRRLLAAGPAGVWETSNMAEALRLLVNIGGQVAVSPDGQHLAVAGGNRIRLLSAEGTMLGDIVPPGVQRGVTRACWSPDGRRIAYVKQFVGEDRRLKTAIETRQVDGSGEKLILTGVGLRPPVWTPDGRLIFAQALPPPNARYQDLWAIGVNSATGAARGAAARIWQGTDVNFSDAALTADGKSLAFLTTRYRINVYTARLDPAFTHLTALSQATVAEAEANATSWVPDSRGILVRADPNEQGLENLYRQDLDLGEPVKVLAAGAHRAILAAAYDPDDPWLYYVYFGSKESFLVRQPSSGGTPESVFPVPSSADARIDCARTATHICAVMTEDATHVNVTLFNPTSGVEGRSLTLQVTSCALSADARQLACLDAREAPVRPVLIDLVSDRRTTLTGDAWTGALALAWTADGGGWIVTRSAGARGSEVRFVDRRGQFRVLWTSPFQRLNMPMVSPDGQRVAFSSWMTERTVWMLRDF